MAEQRIVFTADEAQHLDALRKILKAEVKLEEQMSKRNKTSKKTNDIKKEELTLEQRIEQEKAKIQKKDLESEIRAQARKELGRGELTHAQQVARVKKEILDADKQREYRAQALKELGREQNNEADKHSKLVSNIVAGFASYQAAVGAVKKGWQEINRIATAEREAQRNIGMGTVQEIAPEVLRVMNQDRTMTEKEASSIILKTMIDLTSLNPKDASSAIISSKSAGLSDEALEQVTLFASVNQMPEIVNSLINVLAKLDIKDKEGVAVLLEKLNVGQMNAPTDIAQFTKSFVAFAAFANSLKMPLDQMIGLLATATKVTATPAQASELSKELFNYMAKPELQMHLAEYAGFTKGSDEKKLAAFYEAFPNETVRFALARVMVSELSKTNEGKAKLMDVFSGRESLKYRIMSTEGALEYEEGVLDKLGNVTYEDAQATLKARTATNAYQALSTLSEANVLGLLGSTASQVGYAAQKKGQAKRELARSGELGPESKPSMTWQLLNTFDAFLSVGQTEEELVANKYIIKELLSKIRSTNLPKRPQGWAAFEPEALLSQSELISLELSGKHYNTTTEMGNLIMLIDRLVQLAEEGNTVTRQNYQELKYQIEQQTLSEQRANKVGDQNNPNTSN